MIEVFWTIMLLIRSMQLFQIAIHSYFVQALFIIPLYAERRATQGTVTNSQMYPNGGTIRVRQLRQLNSVRVWNDQQQKTKTMSTEKFIPYKFG